ncbi:hypothetical protein GCM10010399_59120 [Dactylosporangium fulvum]|uniref:NPCBM/NEW2 domain-containing protein n=1 Tax=Dactylosporangium fulvum TaxID=53359 RepID=A0ABY5VPF3_9ACTN|nr:NPCBM/NEW2 domain-containing protein [Dactylosporangium fulvum]UWP78999.1 NPCBM/NEW2 domain-containing protein [Dactylosporangium fulvum]
MTDPWGRRTLAGFGVAAVVFAAITGVWTGNHHEEGSSRQPVREQENFVSDLPYTALRNGSGPVERNRTNGSEKPDDGVPIILAGVAHERGLGVHTPSAVRLYPRPGCLRFTAVVGVDPVHDTGSAEFRVEANDKTVFTTGPIPAGEAREISVEIVGMERLDLVVEDHAGPVAAVWADAKLVCSQ